MEPTGSYTGRIPGWGTGELVGLVSARVVSSSIVTSPADSIFGSPPTNATELVLQTDSLVDQTDAVQSDGTVDLRFDTANGAKYHLFAYYQYQDLAKNLDIQLNSTETIFDNGSYTVDHYSGRGAQTTIDFWESHILNDAEIRSLLGDVGKYAWEDSLEIKSNISWSPSLPDRFQKMNGYSLRKYLPLFMYGNNNPGVQLSAPGDLKCVLDGEDGGQGYLNDFRKTLANGYQEYLTTISTWAESLGLQYSAQVSYNLPLDMESSIAAVHAPECESLAFNDNIDGYRQFSGVANVAQKNVISNEMGADMSKAFALPLSVLLSQINQAFAGGVNQVVLHGQSYTGNYYDTTWPGYASFFLLFSETYYNKQPAWSLGYPDAFAYTSRNQYILHLGQPRTDVVMYNKASITDPQLSTVYSGHDLLDTGCTYTYLSPDNFNDPHAYVANGTLAPEGPAYKAMVVTSTQNVTLSAVQTLLGYAKAGLPIILSGGSPGYYASRNTSTHAAVSSALQDLQHSDNVYTVEPNQVSQKLQDLHLAPRVSVSVNGSANGTWYPVYRSDNTTSTDYVFVFSESNTPSEGTITVQTTKTPYVFNSWTGRRVPLLHYQEINGALRIPLRLAGNQTVILAFSDTLAKEIDTPSTHAVQLPRSVVGYNYSSTAGLELHVVGDGVVRFSSGKIYNLPSLSPSSFALTNWTLTAEHWTAPSNMSNASMQAQKHNTTHHLPSSHLPSWLDIPRLQNASGVGYYRTTFQWPSTGSEQGTGQDSKQTGAYITLPPISHGLQVYINGQKLPSMDFSAPRADISGFVVGGQNRVEMVVPTVMWNYIRSIFGELKIAGSEPLLQKPLPGRVETGVVGEVRVMPFRRIFV